ncbi:MAG: lytic transglycosylase domain-containing protein [Alphaproteobacteria bacterium]|nr:lytic transglycosylase domain-containing protein [Alphaproteobacteria bacterium]
MENPLSHVQTSNVQKQTIKALQAINQGRWSIGRDLIAHTKDPLSAKLYYWLVFSHDHEEYSFGRLAQFIRNNPEWPNIYDLRMKAEFKMPDNLPAVDVTLWFNDYPPLTTQGADKYLQALIFSGQTKKAKIYLSNWWSKTHISKEDQRKIYKKYKNFITFDAHRKRFDVLLFSKQYTNARAVAGILGSGYKKLAEARIALAEDKKNVNVFINKVPDALKNDSGLLYERLRWRRKKNLNMGAIEILNIAPSIDQISNPKSWWKERHIMIRRLIEKKKYKGAYHLASNHKQKAGLSYAQGEWLSGWLLLRFLDNAPKALQHFEALYHNVKTPVSKARAAYWAGRALKTIGQTEFSDKWFSTAAQYQTVFYGQMAGAELGLKSALPHASPPILTSENKSIFQKNELIQVTILFKAAGMRKEASNFIQSFVANNTTPQAYRFAADLSAEIKQYHDAVQIAKKATKNGLFLTAQSYPVITDKLSRVSVEWALIHALIRQESMFDEHANSRAGARGLMQLMPETAKDVARKIGISHQTSWLTLRPDHNILLGSQYLVDMLLRFGGSYPLAIAAYNAGPSRVDKWLKIYGDPRTGDINLIDWIEMIPIYETRNYVQRVMESVYVYRLRLKNIQKRPDTPIHIAMRYKS